jgi:hypothetical protein
MEDYTISKVNGFIVANDKYYSKVFGTLEEAKEHLAGLVKTPEQEEIKVVKRNVKK